MFHALNNHLIRPFYFLVISTLIIPATTLGNAQEFLKSHLEEPPSYQEIPYYLRKLSESKLEGKIMEFNKKIHDAVVAADLSDKKVLKELDPIIDKILIAMDSGLDRPNVSSDSMWLSSAVEYYSREKGRSVIDVPEAEWMAPQIDSLDGKKLSVYPDKILVFEKRKTYTLHESSEIHEAVFSPDGTKVAFFRSRSEGANKAEIWVINVKNKKAKRVAKIPSCHTILFSLNGKKIIYQEKPKSSTVESTIGIVSSRGGRTKRIAQGRLLQTVVQKGEYEGSLIIYKNTIHHWGVAKYECPYAYTLSGKELGRLKAGPCR